MSIPEVEIDRWRLSVRGSVEKELTYAYGQLMKGPLVEITRDFHCVTGWSIADVKWEGVPIIGLAAEAGLKPDAR